MSAIPGASCLADARKDGAAARRAGKALAECPYSGFPEEIALGVAWIAGWRENDVYLVTSKIPGGPCNYILRTAVRYTIPSALAEQQEWEYQRGVPTWIDYSNDLDYDESAG